MGSQIHPVLGSVLLALLSAEQPLCFEQRLTQLTTAFFYHKSSPFAVSGLIYVHIKVSWNWINLEN